MFSNPQQIVDELTLTTGMRVADLGSGSGAYTIAAGKKVGDAGKVYSIDIQKDLLVRVKNEAAQAHLRNVEIVVGDLEKLGGSRLRDFAVDVVIVANLLFQITDKKIFIDEIRRIVKPEGRVLVVDWEGSFGGIGPTSATVVPASAAKVFFEKAGFIKLKDISAGEHHYGIIFKKIG